MTSTASPKTSSPWLSKSRALFVIARDSTFTYKGRAADIKTLCGYGNLLRCLEQTNQWSKRKNPRLRTPWGRWLVQGIINLLPLSSPRVNPFQLGGPHVRQDIGNAGRRSGQPYHIHRSW